MYPLLSLGPLNLSTGGLLLVLAVFVGGTLFERIAGRLGGEQLAEQAARATLPALAGALLGGRLWHGLLSWDLYGRSPALFVAVRLAEFAWPGALLGGVLAAWLWCRWRRVSAVALADAAALALPAAQAIACVGLLLSGEAFGLPTALPWAVELLGASRHPTQLYLALAALLSLVVLHVLSRRTLAPGTLFAAYLGLQGLTLLLLEPLRADSLLVPGGVRAAQVAGLGLVMVSLFWFRRAAGAQGAVASSSDA